MAPAVLKKTKESNQYSIRGITILRRTFECAVRDSQDAPILASKTDVSPSPRPVGTVSWLLGYRKADARVVGNCESVSP